MTEFAKKHFGMFSILAMVFVLAVSVLFGFKKKGFYIDEYYLYTFANGEQSGIAINPGEWNDTSGYIDLLTSDGDENFHFKQTYDFVENGVHPLLYYITLHFMSSVFSGVFSKWIGISINILLMIPILFFVKNIAWKLSGENETVTLLTILLYGLSPATVSMVVLVRMYLMMSLFVVWYAYLHIRDLEREKLSVTGFLLPLFICGFFGFLTQYFFVVIMFFITFCYAFYLIFSCHRIKDAIIYGATALASLISTYFVWPVSVYHIFKGYRGKGAVSQLKDVSHFGNRLWTHLQYLNKMVFGGILPLFLLLLIIGIIFIIRRYLQIKTESKTLKDLSVSTRGMILLGIASVLSFLALSQIGLMDGGITCCRQLYSAYALFLLLIPVGTAKLTAYLGKGKQTAAVLITATLTAVILISGHVQGSVLYLYENESVALDYAKEHPDSKVVMFQMDDGNYDWCIQELMQYPQVYYVSVNDLDTAKDETIANADELLVYVSTSADQEQCFDSIYQQNPNLTQADHLWDTSAFFSVYRMH